MYRWNEVSPDISLRSERASGARRSDFEKKTISCVGRKGLLAKFGSRRLKHFTNRLSEVTKHLATQDMEVVGRGPETMLSLIRGVWRLQVPGNLRRIDDLHIAVLMLTSQLLF